jgi:hypothetical protein
MEAQCAINLLPFPSSAAARMQKLSFGTRVIVLPAQTTPTQQTFCVVLLLLLLLLPDPPDTIMAVFGYRNSVSGFFL